jgi:hypothetical protein
MVTVQQTSGLQQWMEIILALRKVDHDGHYTMQVGHFKQNQQVFDKVCHKNCTHSNSECIPVTTSKT